MTTNVCKTVRFFREINYLVLNFLSCFQILNDLWACFYWKFPKVVSLTHLKTEANEIFEPIRFKNTIATISCLYPKCGHYLLYIFLNALNNKFPLKHPTFYGFIFEILPMKVHRKLIALPIGILTVIQMIYECSWIIW